MKIRSKNAKEKEYDQTLMIKARRELAEEAVKFAQEFAECEGDVFYSSYKKFSNMAWHYEREKENAAMPKVGPTWDWENKVCGAYRYNEI
jgi:hypothetical protein